MQITDIGILHRKCKEIIMFTVPTNQSVFYPTGRIVYLLLCIGDDPKTFY